MKYLKFYFLLFIIIGCRSNNLTETSTVNKEQASIYLNYEITKETIIFDIRNSLFAPITVRLDTDDSVLRNNFNTITIQKLKDSIFTIKNTTLTEKNLKFKVELGDVKKEITHKTLQLPFSNGKSYKILQSYNGSFSHNTNESRYAIDFAMKVGDTVYAADDGYIVGIVDFNDKYGNDKSFEKFANFVTTYNDETGIYSQYVHLQKNKILVKIGDKISKNKPIGLIGLSGFIDGEHLHFNTFIPTESGRKSIPVNFEKYKGEELKRDDIVTH